MWTAEHRRAADPEERGQVLFLVFKLALPRARRPSRRLTESQAGPAFDPSRAFFRRLAAPISRVHGLVPDLFCFRKSDPPTSLWHRRDGSGAGGTPVGARNGTGPSIRHRIVEIDSPIRIA